MSRFVLLLISLGALHASTLAAAPRDGQIRYAEPIRIERALPAPALDGSAGPRRLDFDAYGRRFELELESNERILRQLSPERRRALPPRALYKGRLVGQSGSWARLTLLQDGVHGLIYDGRELYLLAPAERVKTRLATAVVAAGRDTLLFRAADTESTGGTCTTVETGEAQVTLATEYASLARELSLLRVTPGELTAGTYGRELQIAMLGDLEFSTRRLDPEGDLLALANAADGIFAAQAGVIVVATVVHAFRQFPDPFDESEARRLLDEVVDYRNSAPAIRATDVAHLATGRDLDGTTVGIAFRSAVCDPRNAASVSEQNDPSAGYLIFAHELGHNLGAPHDGEAGSVCSFEPRNFLMAPSVSFSSRLSPCSIEQIREVVASASCLAIAPADASVAIVGPTPIGAFTTQQVTAQIEVASIGGETLHDVRVEVTAGGLAVLGASVPDGTCTSAIDSTECRLGDLSSGTSRTIEVRIDAGYVPGQFPLRASLVALDDSRPANNVAEATIRVQPGAFVVASIQSQPSVVAIGGRGQVLAAVRNVGVIPLGGLNVEIESTNPALAIDAIAAPGATCTTSGPQHWRCSYAEALAVGASFTLDATVRGVAAGFATLIVRPLLSQLGTATVAITAIPVKPDADVALTLDSVGLTSVIEGKPFRVAARLQADGVGTARGIVLRGVLPETIAMRGITGAGSCTVSEARELHCEVGDLPSGVIRIVELNFEPTVPGDYWLSLEVSADNDEVAGNNLLRTQIGVAADIDIGVEATSIPPSLKIGRSIEYVFTVTTTRRPVPTASLRFNASSTHLAIESGTTPAGPCAIVNGELMCHLGDLPPDARLPVTVRARAISTGAFHLFASVSTSTDVDYSNQSLNREVTVLPIGDASVRAEAITGQPRQNQPFEFAAFTVSALRATEQVAVELTLPGSVRVESATIAGGSCNVATGSIRCTLGDMASADNRRLNLRFVAAEVGALAISARTLSADDDDPSNDAATLSLDVTTVVVQPPPPSSGGGGGGALDPAWLLLLLGGFAAQPRRSVRT